MLQDEIAANALDSERLVDVNSRLAGLAREHDELEGAWLAAAEILGG